MSNIVFFSNHLARKKGTGVARYAFGLLEGFAELDAPPHVLPVATWSNREKGDLEELKKKTGLSLLPTRRWLSPLLWMTIGIPKLEHLLDFHIDIVHVNDMGYLVATAKPFIVTVHDIGSLTHPHFFKNNSGWIVEKSLENAMKKADAFICVSQATADALLEYVQSRYTVDLIERVHVIHEGIATEFLRLPDLSVLDRNNRFDFSQEPFILAVGKLSPRKNLQVVIKALKKLQSRIPHHLVMVGGNGWDFQEVIKLVSSYGLTDRVHFLGYVNDQELHALYGKATLFIYPSLFEGFGLPVLEAMASGCPVITSNISSLPEVAGDAALLVDPLNVDDVATAIEMICKNDSSAIELRRRGKKRVQKFSWKKCAEQTAKIYDNMVSKKDKKIQ